MKLATLTVAEAAKILRYDEETVRRMVRRKELRGWGRPARIPVDVLISMGISYETIVNVVSKEQLQ